MRLKPLAKDRPVAEKATPPEWPFYGAPERPHPLEGLRRGFILTHDGIVSTFVVLNDTPCPVFWVQYTKAGQPHAIPFFVWFVFFVV